VWRPRPVILALERLMPENGEFEVSLSYILKCNFEKKKLKKKETGFNDSENKKLLVSCLTVGNDKSFWI
jgi:hypothetical protein